MHQGYIYIFLPLLRHAFTFLFTVYLSSSTNLRKEGTYSPPLNQDNGRMEIIDADSRGAIRTGARWTSSRKGSHRVGAPGREVEPNPPAGFTVLFVPYLRAGLRLPESDFLIEVLNHYRIELVHLVPNSVLVLSIFAHMFEAFLGITPSLCLFRFYYQIIRNKKGSGALGSLYFKFQDTDKRVFPFLATKNSNPSWNKKWFYSEVPKESRITYNRSTPPEWSSKNWGRLYVCLSI